MIGVAAGKLQDFAKGILPDVLIATARDIRNLREGQKFTKSLSRLISTWLTCIVMLSLFLSNTIPLAGVDTLGARVLAIGTLTIVPMWVMSNLSKQFSRYHTYRNSQNINPDKYIIPPSNPQTGKPYTFTNSRYFLSRIHLTDVVHQLFLNFSHELGNANEEDLQKEFMNKVVPEALEDMLTKSELHDIAKAALCGARNNNPAPFFEYIRKKSVIKAANKSVLATLAGKTNLPNTGVCGTGHIKSKSAIHRITHARRPQEAARLICTPEGNTVMDGDALPEFMELYSPTAQRAVDVDPSSAETCRITIEADTPLKVTRHFGMSKLSSV